MNNGKYVFAQLLAYIYKYEFDKCVKRYNGDYWIKDLNCWNLFVQLMFGQLTSLHSLGDICLCLKVHKNKLYHLGMAQNVTKSSLSRALEKRDYRIFRDYAYYLISKVRPLYQNTKVTNVDIDNVIFALDSTTISTSIKLATWAEGKYSRGAVKAHTLLDIRGSIPTFIHITDGKYHDSNVLDVFAFEKNDIYAMDKAYFDLVALYKINMAGAYFVTRPRTPFAYMLNSSAINIDKESGIMADNGVVMRNTVSKRNYPIAMRRIEYLDKEKQETLIFITNNFELEAIDIANIYRNRWQIEVFFKWIKQNLTIKHLWGYSENAVQTHIWIAISTYLIIAYLKAQLQSNLSIYEITQILRVSALDKTNIRELLTETQPISNQNVNERPSLFD